MSKETIEKYLQKKGIKYVKDLLYQRVKKKNTTINTDNT